MHWDNILVQVTETPIRGDVLLDLLLTNIEELTGEVKISLGCSDHALVEFMISRDIGQEKCIVNTLKLRKVNLQMFKELVDRTLLLAGPMLSVQDRLIKSASMGKHRDFCLFLPQKIRQ